MYCSADASFAVHQDLKGHTGFTIHVSEDNAPFYVISKKQKLNTLSSTESELVALSDAASHVLAVKEFLESIGIKQQAVPIEQDNTSAILLCNRGPGKAGSSKSISVRYFWITDHLRREELKLIKVPSKQLLADGLTKPLSITEFKVWRDRILNTQ